MHSRSAPATAVSSIALRRSLHTCQTALLHWYRLPHRAIGGARGQVQRPRTKRCNRRPAGQSTVLAWPP